MKTTTIFLDGEPWEVPRGFGAAYREAADLESNPQAISDRLALIGYEAKPEDVAAWPLRKRLEAEVYAANVHLRASDNILRAHPKPEWLPDPWLGPEKGEGVFAGPTGTVI